MKLLQARSGGINHAPRLYRDFHVEGGADTTRGRLWDRRNCDPVPFLEENNRFHTELYVARIYIDFCEGGDLTEQLRDENLLPMPNQPVAPPGPPP